MAAKSGTHTAGSIRWVPPKKSSRPAVIFIDGAVVQVSEDAYNPYCHQGQACVMYSAGVDRAGRARFILIDGHSVVVGHNVYTFKYR